jgi:hypothetical protein
MPSSFASRLAFGMSNPRGDASHHACSHPAYYKKTHPMLSILESLAYKQLILLKLVDLPSVLRYNSPHISVT